MAELWVDNKEFYSTPTLSKVLRHAVDQMCKYQQLAEPDDAIGKNQGEKHNWPIFSQVEDQGGEISENSEMPETGFTTTHGTLTVTEYGNSVKYSGKFDSLSELPVKSVIEKVLKKDAHRALDNAAYNQFNATPLVVTPTGGTSTDSIVLVEDGTPTVVNDVEMGKEHIKAISDEMKERDIPFADNDNYFAVGRPRSFRAAKNDIEEVYKYVPEGYGEIKNGEIGRYENVRLIEQTNIAKEDWVNNKSSQVHFMGDDRVCEGIAIPTELRGKIATDYGRGKGIAWYYLGGFGICHTEPKQARIVKWGSAN